MKTIPTYQWQPTTPEIAARAGIPEHLVERFDQNTSPLPPPAVDRIIKSRTRLNEYPAASYADLRNAVASNVNLDPDNVAPGAGADELILLSARAFLDPGDIAVVATPTYPLYQIATAQARATLREVAAIGPDFSFPTQEFLETATDAQLIWLCIPNNPTGNGPDNAALETLLATGSRVIIDAAYAEFSEDDWTSKIRLHPNLLVLHTMSKAYGLAGARVGYAIGDRAAIASIDAIRPPSSIGSLSLEVALDALNAPEQMQANVSSLRAARVDLAAQLTKLGLRVLESSTNFLLCEYGPNAADLQDKLMVEGIVVRKFPADGPLEDYLRFTVRTPAANARLIETLERKME